jgi:hypothetical protein
MWHSWKLTEIRSVLVVKTEEKKPLERHRRRWDDNIKMKTAAYGEMIE